MKHNPNFCCACGNHIKKDEWVKQFNPIAWFTDPKDGFAKGMKLKMCPICKCVQGE